MKYLQLKYSVFTLFYGLNMSNLTLSVNVSKL